MQHQLPAGTCLGLHLTFLIPIILSCSRSLSIITAPTTILAKKAFCWEISLELRAVMAHFSSSFLHSTFIFLLHSHSNLFGLVNCQLGGSEEISEDDLWVQTFSTQGFTCFRNSTVSRVTEVVSSPTSASWDLAISTKVFAAGWTTSRSFRIVSPSLEIVALLRPSTRSLSMPCGTSQGRSYSLGNDLVGTYLQTEDALGAIGPLFQQDNWCGHHFGSLFSLRPDFLICEIKNESNLYFRDYYKD